MQGGKTLDFAGSSETFIGWYSGKTTFVPLWERIEGAWLWTLGSLMEGHNWFLNQFVEIPRRSTVSLSASNLFWQKPV
jgi:hypothetical protein